MNEDISNLINQFNNMMKNDQIPKEIQNIVKTLKNNESDSNQCSYDVKSENQKANHKDISSSSSDSSDSIDLPEFDINTMIKIKKVMESMNSNKDDPRANLLRSLKPYLKESRKSKVDQYVQIFNMGKALEIFNSLGGDAKK